MREYLAYRAVPTNAQAIASFVYYHLAQEAGAWSSQPKEAGELGTDGVNRRALAAASPYP
jgi:hypothetical protein